MKQIWVRPVTQDDLENMAHWLVLNGDKNLLDLDVAKYPETTHLCAHDGKPLLYLPVQLTAMLESLAPRPDASRQELAAALEKLMKVVIFLALKNGLHELYFVTTDQQLEQFAVRHGFEVMPGTTLRLKLDKLGQE